MVSRTDYVRAAVRMVLRRWRALGWAVSAVAPPALWWFLMPVPAGGLGLWWLSVCTLPAVGVMSYAMARVLTEWVWEELAVPARLAIAKEAEVVAKERTALDEQGGEVWLVQPREQAGEQHGPRTRVQEALHVAELDWVEPGDIARTNEWLMGHKR